MIGEDEARTTGYEILTKLGLPTFFAIALLCLLVYLSVLYNRQGVENASVNALKFEKFSELLNNQQTILHNEAQLFDENQKILAQIASVSGAITLNTQSLTANVLMQTEILHRIEEQVSSHYHDHDRDHDPPHRR